jgi:hypothetical protein
MSEWDDSDYLRILPDSVTIGARPDGRSKDFSV